METTVTPEETHSLTDVKHELCPTQLQDVTSTPSPPLTARQIRLLRYANYQRHPKPPYSYVGIIIHAIHLSPEKCLTLAQIKDKMSEMFDFFRGEYEGWKDSVRHNLSHNACFVRSSQTVSGKSKASLWSVDLSKVPPNAFKRQENSMARKGFWACDLHVQLGVPEIFLPLQSTRFTLVQSRVSSSPGVDSPCSDTENVWHEQRNNSPFLLDSSIESTPKLPRKSRAPIRLRKTNAPRTNIMQESSKQRLMQLITECADQSNISQEEAIQNLSQLCMSADLSKAPSSSPYASTSNAPYNVLYQTTPPFYSPCTYGAQYYNGYSSTSLQDYYALLAQLRYQESHQPSYTPPVKDSQPLTTGRWYSPPDMSSAKQFSPVTPTSPHDLSTSDSFRMSSSYLDSVPISTFHSDTAQTSAVDLSAQEKTSEGDDVFDIKQEDNSTTEISYARL